VSAPHTGRVPVVPVGGLSFRNRARRNETPTRPHAHTGSPDRTLYAQSERAAPRAPLLLPDHREREGAEHVFGLPGEEMEALLFSLREAFRKALEDGISLIEVPVA
jgi:hypothetical protein